MESEREVLELYEWELYQLIRLYFALTDYEYSWLESASVQSQGIPYFVVALLGLLRLCQVCGKR